MSTPPPQAPDLDHAWGHAVTALDLTTLPVGERHRGVSGRTLSGPVTRPDGSPAWLRVESATKPGGRMWGGNRLAEELLPRTSPGPDYWPHTPGVPPPTLWKFVAFHVDR